MTAAVRPVKHAETDITVQQERAVVQHVRQLTVDGQRQQAPRQRQHTLRVMKRKLGQG